MQLQDIMTKGFCYINPDTKLSEVAAHMKRHNVGALPICDSSSRLLGIVTDRDLVLNSTASGVCPADEQVRQVMTAEPITAPPDMDINQACELMGREQIRRLPITDSGRLVGFVSIGDLAVNCQDDHIVANMLRQVSLPVRACPPCVQASATR